jgi:hypothetical protein
MVVLIMDKPMKKKIKPDSKEYCLNCWKKLEPVKDPVAKKITGYLFTCSCLPKGTFISIG